MQDILDLLGCTKEQYELANIFHSYGMEKLVSAYRAQTRFVHYTTAETAVKLLTKKEIWLRKSSTMNDFLEVDHGIDCLSKSYKQNVNTIKELFESLFPGICKRIEDHFNSWIPTLKFSTYLASVSEHVDSSELNEDHMGRLSMWRAYGGFAGVALVLNGGVFHKPIISDALKAYASPVAYLDEAAFESQFQNLLMRIEKSKQMLKLLGEEQFFHRILHSFRSAALCTKHPGFREEKEWRVIYCPFIGKSSVIKEEIESIAGIPQMVCKLPLKDNLDLGIEGFELPKLIDRIIVGPTLYPYEISEALIELLTSSGVENASSKVVVSNIPLRQHR